MTPSEQITAALREIKDLADKATPGPWTYEPDDEGSSMGWIMKGNTSLFDVRGDSAQQAHNAEFAAASRDTITRLVKALEHSMITGQALTHMGDEEFAEQRHAKLVAILNGDKQ